jgi:hypothetical protein
MKKFLFYFISLFLILLLPIFSYANQLKGIVKDEKGEPLPFASIYIKGTSKGTTANNLGQYKLDLNEGNYTIVYQYVGYQKKEVEVEIKSSEKILNITLQPNQKTLKQVVIKNNENPAIAIIKKTIKKRPYYNKQVDKFKANAYIKGNLRLDTLSQNNIIFKLAGVQDEDTSMELNFMKGILYLSESVCEIAYKRPDKLKTVVLSSRVSGKADSYGFSDPIFINMYENNINISPQITPRGFISPIADAALLSYNYELLGAFVEDGKLINQIKVIPKRKFEPLFEGVINIIENEWRLHSIDLIAQNKQQLEKLDSLRIRQVFIPVEDVLLVKDQVFDMKVKLFGFSVAGSFINSFSNYQLHYDPTTTFNKFVVEYKDSALSRKKDYWDTIRPVPLTEDEQKDFIKKDSLAQVSKLKKDSIDKKNNTITLRQLFLSGIQHKINANTTFHTSPLIGLSSIHWNTVEGLNYTYRLGLTTQIDKDQSFITNLSLRYGWHNRQFNARLSTQYRFGKTHKSTLRASGGRYVFQFNNTGPVNPLLNSIYTLLVGENYMKLYQAWFGSIGYTYQRVEGISISQAISFQSRSMLTNSTYFSFNQRDRFTANYPTELINHAEPNHQGLLYTGNISYQPGRKYIKYPDRIEAAGSRYPTFGLGYTIGLPIASSDVDYARWILTMRHALSLNQWGNLRYNLAAGGFLYNRESYTPDYTHFNGNQMILATPYVNSFQLSPYYLNSNTENLFGLLHVEHHFNGLLTNKIPLFRRLKWYLVAGSNMYCVNRDNNYIELSAGLENIGYKLFRIVRIDAIAGYRNLENPVYGIRIGINGAIFGFEGFETDNFL